MGALAAKKAYDLGNTAVAKLVHAASQNNCELSSGEGGQAGRGVCEAELMVVEAIEKEEGE